MGCCPEHEVGVERVASVDFEAAGVDGVVTLGEAAF